MGPLGHILLFLLSAAVIWFLSGILIDATDRVARRHNKPGFAVAFFVLGFLTSISEISVATNATLEGVPQVSAGNLLGASTVIFLFIIPLLAAFGNGIPMKRSLTPFNTIFTLAVVAVPALLLIDGKMSPVEGLVMLLLYLTLVYCIRKYEPTEKTAAKAIRETEQVIFHTNHATLLDVGKIVIGAVIIFIAGNMLVDESVYFAKVLSIPVSFVGLLLLSLGTNIPELVIAVRSVLGHHKDIAFGDYMGSAAANTVVFGVLAIVNGSFSFAQSEAVLTFVILSFGLTLFFVFARSKNNLSRKEGILLLSLYVLFVLSQIGNAMRLSHGNAPVEALEQGDTLHLGPQK